MSDAVWGERGFAAGSSACRSAPQLTLIYEHDRLPLPTKRLACALPISADWHCYQPTTAGCRLSKTNYHTIQQFPDNCFGLCVVLLFRPVAYICTRQTLRIHHAYNRRTTLSLLNFLFVVHLYFVRVYFLCAVYPERYKYSSLHLWHIIHTIPLHTFARRDPVQTSAFRLLSFQASVFKLPVSSIECKLLNNRFDILQAINLAFTIYTTLHKGVSLCSPK